MKSISIWIRFIGVFSHPAGLISLRNSIMSVFATLLLFANMAATASDSFVSPQVTHSAFIPKQVQEKIKVLEIPFIQNVGQMDDSVAFYAPTFGGTVFVTLEGRIVYSLSSDNKKGNSTERVVLGETPVGASAVEVTGSEAATTQFNYFIGDKSTWRNKIASYKSLSLGELYPGISLDLYAYGNNVEKLFVVAPGASPDQIVMDMAGAKSLSLNEKGQLVANTRLGPVVFTRPVAYQEFEGSRTYIDVAYTLFTSRASKTADRYGFNVGSYDPGHVLHIDPLLASTFLGGANDDFGYAIALDGDNNVYVTGSTASTGFPTVGTPYDAGFNTSDDVFVAKLNSDLSTLVAATFLGGSLWERGYVIALDSSGAVFVAGETVSANFPLTGGAYSNCCDPYDFFISKLDNSLSTLLASTLLGGGNIGSDVHAMAVDSQDNIFLLGDTLSDQFPTTASAYDRTYADLQDTILAKMSNDLTTLLAATYLGGSGTERPYAMVLDNNDNVYVTGYTSSADYPTTINAYDDTHDGGNNVFISKLDSDLSNLTASTFLGDSSAFAYGIALDTMNNVYVSGWTFSDSFPTTPGAYDESYNNQDDIFVSKLDNDLSVLSASTYLGGSLSDRLHGMAMDSSNSVYLIGLTTSTDFPTAGNPHDASYNGASDVFISKLSGSLDSLIASTYLGGTDEERISSARDFIDIVLDSNGGVYASGWTESTDFPTASYDESHNGTVDAFLSKLSMSDEQRLYFANPASNTTQQTFLRFINPNDSEMAVEVFGTDDAGVQSANGPVSFMLPAQASKQFNAQDLENGNVSKGLTGGLGNGQGKWQLLVKSDKEIKAMGLIRTPDGFLTSVNDVVPDSGTDNIVYFANPASNITQQTFLRIVNTNSAADMITITGIDDAGVTSSGTMTFSLAANESKQINAQDLEGGNVSKGLAGSLGNGTGKWRLTIASPLSLEVMSLIRTPDGFLTNLSGMVDQKPDGDFIIPFGNPASDTDKQTFLRIINTSSQTGTVTISGLDDTGMAGPGGSVMFQLGPNESKQMNAQDLESGNVSKGLSGMLGDGNGRWIYTVSADMDIQVMSLVRTPDGFLTNLSRITPLTANTNDVYFFNPASNTNQVSSLRIINMSNTPGSVTITGFDDNGDAGPGGDVTFTILANSALEITAQDLENGNALLGLVGALGNGTGKWRLQVSSVLELKVQGLMNTPSGFLTNLSRTSE